MSTKIYTLKLTPRLENEIVKLSSKHKVDLNSVEKLPEQGLLIGEPKTGLTIKVIHEPNHYLLDCAGEQIRLEKFRNDYQRELIFSFAEHVSSKGFKVYVSTGGSCGFTYMIYSDGCRVVYVQYDLFNGLTAGGCYKPSPQCGSGWGIGDLTGHETKEQLRTILYTPSPNWANRNPTYYKLDEYLAKHKHSNYELFEV